MAKAIDRVLEINEHLPNHGKIRVVSISTGILTWEIGGRALRAAIDRANEAGVFVITTSPWINFDFRLMGLGRHPMADPNELSSFEPGFFFYNDFFQEHTWYLENNILFVPMDSRTSTAHTGNVDYRFCRSGGLSWAAPWLAGMYALCVQVYPDITPELFIQLAFETGDEISLFRGGNIYTLRTVINPIRLIERLELMRE